jgi:hypothetical protein
MTTLLGFSLSRCRRLKAKHYGPEADWTAVEE